jgi:hypothetical protein
MVHVSVGKENQIEPGQVMRPKRRRYEAPRAYLGEASANSNSRLEGRVCEHQCAVYADQDACMPQPGNCHTSIRPAGWVWTMRRRLDVRGRARTLLFQTSADVRTGKPQVVLERQ